MCYYSKVVGTASAAAGAPCKALDSFTTTYLIPDGWSLLHMENTPPQGPYKAPIPACAVLKSADGKQLAVIIRGTRTAEEWQVGECCMGWNRQLFICCARSHLPQTGVKADQTRQPECAAVQQHKCNNAHTAVITW